MSMTNKLICLKITLQEKIVKESCKIKNENLQRLNRLAPVEYRNYYIYYTLININWI